jgi:hypothetical protein
MSPAPLSPIPPTISPSNPQSTTPPTPSLNSLVATDLAASNELAERITQLRLDIANGKPLPPKKVDLTERSNRDMVKDLVSRVEKIETSAELDATDRETLQALNARLAVCDLQAMRLAELRDLEVGARMGRKVIGLRAEGVEEEEEEEMEMISRGSASMIPTLPATLTVKMTTTTPQAPPTPPTSPPTQPPGPSSTGS